MKKSDDLPKINRTLEKYKNYNIKVNIEAADGTAKAQFIKSIELNTILNNEFNEAYFLNLVINDVSLYLEAMEKSSIMFKDPKYSDGFYKKFEQYNNTSIGDRISNHMKKTPTTIFDFDIQNDPMRFKKPAHVKLACYID